MKKYGLGWTQGVVAWYSSVWKEYVRDRSSGFRPLAQIGGIAVAAAALFVTVVVVIVTAIIDTVVEIGEWIVGLFNASDDDQARATVASLSCSQINMLSDEQLNSMTEAMLSGPTTDGDERALLKIVECLDCERLTSTYWPRFGRRIQSDTDGADFDRLRVALRRCRLVEFANWDDDATRLFIRDSSCEDLQLLTLQEIKDLVSNLFAGSTGDDDENAILKLIGCLSPETVRSLVRERGFSVSDFDDEVDGAQWRRLRRVFSEKGV